MFVVIEGADKSGKTTLVNSLKQVLPKAFPNTKVTFLRYPNRDGPIGSVIHDFLTGKITMNDETAQLLFAADRWNTKDVLEKALSDDGIVVCDRYIHSGLAYAAARGVSVAWCAELNSGLPAPDLIVYINIDSQTQESRGLKEQDTCETPNFSTEEQDMCERHESLRADGQDEFGRHKSHREAFETPKIQKCVREQYTSLMDSEIALGHSIVLYVDGRKDKEYVMNCALLAISDVYKKEMPIRPFLGY